MFMAIDTNIIPNIFLIISKVLSFNLSPNTFVNLSIVYTINIFMIIAKPTSYTLNILLSDSIVDSVPGPAINGKATGNICALFILTSDGLNNLILNINSIPIANIISDPANAKLDTFIPNKLSKCSPKAKNNIINTPDIIVEFNDLISPCSFLIDSSVGILPIISITANSVNVADIICLSIILFIYLCKYNH